MEKKILIMMVVIVVVIMIVATVTTVRIKLKKEKEQNKNSNFPQFNGWQSHANIDQLMADEMKKKNCQS